MYLPKYFWIIQQDDAEAKEAEMVEWILDNFMDRMLDEYLPELKEDT